MTSEEKEGWGLILNSKKWHYYQKGRSLCGRYMKFTSHDLENGNDDSLDNCVNCRKKLIKLRAPTKSAQAFMDANDQSPVYAGAAHEGGGGTYTLTDERSFTLSLMDCRSLPEGYPKWVHDA